MREVRDLGIHMLCNPPAPVVVVAERPVATGALRAQHQEPRLHTSPKKLRSYSREEIGRAHV